MFSLNLHSLWSGVYESLEDEDDQNEDEDEVEDEDEENHLSSDQSRLRS